MPPKRLQRLRSPLNDLPSMWDSDAVVRRTIRSGMHLLGPGGVAFKATVKSCSEFMEAILPVLEVTKARLVHDSWSMVFHQFNIFNFLGKCPIDLNIIHFVSCNFLENILF